MIIVANVLFFSPLHIQNCVDKSILYIYIYIFFLILFFFFNLNIADIIQAQGLGCDEEEDVLACLQGREVEEVLALTHLLGPSTSWQGTIWQVG